MSNGTVSGDSFVNGGLSRQGGGTIAQAESNRAVAQVQAAMTIAKRFPRDEVAALDRIRNACSRPRLAEAALYSYARGGTDITGPSIRLAEAVAQQWGNLDFGIVELDQENGESTVEAYAWDLETNTRVSKVFRVPHVRHTKSGSRPLTDPRDIYENVANNGARRLRACILGVIPGDVIEEAVVACEQTMNTKCDVGPEAQKKLVAAFRELGVTREQIEKRIQCRVEAIKPAQMVQMRKVYSSIRDGMSAASDWFESVTGAAGDGSGSGSGTGPVSGDALTGKPPVKPAQPKADAAGNTNDGGPTEEDLRGAVNHVDPLPAILGGIRKAKTADEVDKIVLEEQGQGGHSEEVQRAIWEAGEARKGAIGKK